MATDKRGGGTRLNRIHPYPAMIADDFALRAAMRYVKEGSVVLDPFCGTGRTLYAAASFGAECFGIDINPVAVMIAQAKNVRAIPVMPELALLKRSYENSRFSLQPGRKVKWFSKPVERELNWIIAWINSLSVELNVRVALACVLSATVREVSFCRKRQWKLHRMSARARCGFRPSALKVFKRRLEGVAGDLNKATLGGNVTIAKGDACKLRRVVKDHALPDSYDVIFTSPPYGDSRSTVGYGGMSSMCLGVLQHIDHLDLAFQSGQAIDSQCLGGKNTAGRSYRDTNKYWRGSSESREFVRVGAFLQDLASTCKEIAALSHIGTKVILVVSRRCVRRRRLYIDHFLEDELGKHGFQLVENARRCIEGKQTPYVIDRKARCRQADRVRTMEHELVLTFDKVSATAQSRR
jgi:site-specific DNA-methyltransferase (cytosine-N4-specific)